MNTLREAATHNLSSPLLRGEDESFSVSPFLWEEGS
jgi:hypothetical protein